MRARTPIGRIAEAVRQIVELTQQGFHTEREQKALVERVRRLVASERKRCQK